MAPIPTLHERLLMLDDELQNVLERFTEAMDAAGASDVYAIRSTLCAIAHDAKNDETTRRAPAFIEWGPYRFRLQSGTSLRLHLPGYP